MNGEKKYYNILLESIPKYKKLHIISLIFLIIFSIISIAIPIVSMKIIDIAVIQKNKEKLIMLLVCYLGVNIAVAAIGIIRNYFYQKVSNRIVIDTKLRLINKFFTLNGKYYSEQKTGEVVSVIDGDTMCLYDLTTGSIYSAISDVFVSIGMICLLIYIQWDLLIVALLLSSLVIPVQKYFNKKITSNSNKIRDSYGALSSQVAELIISAKQYVIYNMKVLFNSRYKKEIDKYYDLTITSSFIQSFCSASITLISTLVYIFTFGVGGYKVIIGAMTVGGLVTFTQYSQRLMGPFVRLAQLSAQIKRSSASLQRIQNLLDEESLISNKQLRNEIKGDICFKNVSFSYIEGKTVLKDITLKFEHGKKYSIIGRSGSGKSTIANLSLRLWDVSRGEILVDNINIKDYDLDFLRSNISIVTQEPFLINDSIINNLVLDSKYSMEKVTKVLKDVELYNDFIKMPDGLKTIIGERGSQISGGQKQRIAIARELLRNSPIVIFDEPTASLDTNTEKIINRCINSYFNERTVIIITHRLSLAKDVDEIIVLNEGVIQEQNSHQQLIDLKGLYYSYYKNIQSEDSIING